MVILGPLHTVIVGIDPGKSTGLFILQDGHRMYARQGNSVEIFNAIKPTLQRFADAEDINLHIACERYITGTKGAKSQQNDAMHVIGQAQLIADELNVALEMQTTSDVKGLVPNSMLKMFKLYVTASEVSQSDANDANDAARHALFCYARHYPAGFDLMLQRHNI